MQRNGPFPRSLGKPIVLAWVALVFSAGAFLFSGRTDAAAGAAVVVAMIAVIWSMFTSATLDDKVEALAADVRRIADAIAPVDAAPMHERPDRVQVATLYEVVEIPWEARDAILGELRAFESGRGAIQVFEAVEVSRPVSLDREGKSAVLDAIDVLASNAAHGLDDLDPHLVQLRRHLIDELTADHP